MTRNLLPTLMILISVAVFFFVIDDQYVDLRELLSIRAEVVETEEEFAELQALAEEMDERLVEVEEDHRLLESMLPFERDDARSMIVLDNLVSESGVDMDEGDFSIAQASDESRDIKIQVLSSYDNFKDLLENLEQELKPHDVISLGLNQRTARVFEFDLAVRTYWSE